MNAEPALHLRPGRDRSVRRRHPWIFSGSVATVSDSVKPGATVVVRAADGTALGRAALNPANKLRARMWTFNPDQTVDEPFVRELVRRSVQRRAGLLPDADAMRLVFSEADGIPGLIVDRYGSIVVCQFTTAGAEIFRDTIVDELRHLPGVTGVYERSDADAREREGLGARTGVLWGEQPNDELIMREGTWRFAVDVAAGHKTGFYLDQRNARAALTSVSAGRRVLNVFAYTGAFSVVAAASGSSSVLSIDSSATALATARRNGELNGVDVGELVEADAFVELRRLRDRAAAFDLIIMDPPRLAPTEAHVQRASRAYKDLNLLALKLLAPGGLLMTFSCSGGVSTALFTKIVAGAALDARRSARIVARLGQSPDHPVPLTFPEAEYLKGLVIAVD